MAEKSKSAKPLIHCITNPIAMNQSANAILAIGARPIMAEHPLEVEEITATASALLINIGNISDIRIEAMKKSIAVANTNDIPVVVDAVGIACSSFRRRFFDELLNNAHVTVLKGNYSEILSMEKSSYKATGVDSENGLEIKKVEEAAKNVSKRYRTIVLATGPEDILVDGDTVIIITGGSPQLSLVTGTGCMLGAIIAAFLAFDNQLKSVEKACSFFKKCGKGAQTSKGTGTFMVNLMDRLGDFDGI